MSLELNWSDTLVGLAGSVPRIVSAGADVRDQPLPKGAGTVTEAAAEREDGPVGAGVRWLRCSWKGWERAAPPPLPAVVEKARSPDDWLTPVVEQVGSGGPSQPPVSPPGGADVPPPCPWDVLLSIALT